MNYDYRTFTLDIQNDNPSQYYRGFLRLFFFSLTIAVLILNSSNVHMNYKCDLQVKVDIFKKYSFFP